MIDEILGKVSAYAYAVEKGYTGTETQFAYDLAHAADYASTAGTAAENASESEENAKDSEEAAAQSEGNAEGYAQSAHDDAAAALEAKGQAIAAKNDAVTAKGLAENSATIANSAKIAAAQSEQNAYQFAESAEQDAGDASNSASSASTSSLKSEGFAVGEQNGVPVESGSPYYENNSKYYSEQAAAQLGLVTAEGTRQIGLVTDEGTAQKAAVQEKGEQTLASIPEDYTTLRNDVSSLKSDLNCEISYLSKAISDDLYDKTLKPVSYSSANYKLLDDGRAQSDSNYKIDKYSITAGTTVTIESDHKFQFQSSDSASTLNANNRIGATYGSGTFVVDVPTGATFILVSTPSTGSTAKVYIDKPVSDDLQKRIGVIEDKYNRNVDPFNDSVNLYNGEDFAYGGWSDSSFTLDSTENKITAIIECKPNTQYWIVRNTSLTDNFGRIGTSVTYPVAGTPVTQLVDNIGGSLSYTVTTGADAKYLLFYYTYSASDQFIQITDYATTSLNQNTYPVLSDSLYTKRQVNEIVSQSARKCKVRKTGNKIDIYIPSKTSDKYIRFAYELVDNPSINFYQWKVMDTDVCDSSLNVIFNLYATSNNVEWEGVVQETGASDFIGGYHGDETNEMLSVLIDGKPIDLTSNLNLTECNEIFIVNKSIVNSCDDPTNQLFTRYKVSKWTSEKYTIRNRWIALKDNIALSIVYMTMFSLPIEKGNYGVATSGRYDDGYIVQDPTGTAVAGSCLYPSHYAKTVEFWGDSFYGRCTAIYDSYSNYTCICDRSQTNLFKGYWKQYNNGITMNTNDELNGLSEYEFMF